ncbi:MAG: serine/threonine-protein phosphatase [Deltaproteobacteria bacterium]|nr:serine/threonine-protein phosphatase [Deltaproteobacteria bacterium]MBW2658630.1 serine/threonine-protein phosphatase [Deltaproteobacteria bacterium]
MTLGKIIADGKSCRGKKRNKNDDRLLLTKLDENNLIIAVSDGMGGHPGGDIAAKDIIDCLASINIGSADRADLLRAAIKHAEVNIRKIVKKSPDLEGMGATATTAIIGGGMVYWAHIGDSRIYLMRTGILRQITRDHTFLQDLIDAGDISHEAAINHPMRHVLDQCVGCMDAGIDVGQFEFRENDILLACTDGLTRSVADDEIAAILLAGTAVPDTINSLIETSLQAGNLDDITVAMAFWKTRQE